MAEIVDFHNHYYPPAYLEALARGSTALRVTEDDEGNPVIHYPGDYNVVVPGHRDLEVREEALGLAGVDVQVLTFTSPGTHVESPEIAARLASTVNDALARIVEERGDRFRALATLPLNDPEASVRELERAMDDLGLPGAMLFSNVNGVPLADPRYRPLWEAADEREAVLYIHPIHPLGVEAMTEYWLMPLVGFVADTTLAAAHLVFSGTVERHPGIRWVLAHLGGTIPYLAERLDRGFEAFASCRREIERPPSDYLRRFWYDTVNFDPACLELAAGFAGPGRLLAGSDYPHMIGSMAKMVESVGRIDVSEEEREGILGGNARALLGF
ncbi:MAG TPA: amidohydrolase family protein [Longimicrobiales bacterium]|nr:amidohydrolase family protein [Longimicrobiales bacterium]